MERDAAEPTSALETLASLGAEHRVVRTVPARSAEESADLQGIPLRAPLRTIVVRRGEDGARGVNAHLDPAALVRVLRAEVVDVSVPDADARIRHADCPPCWLRRFWRRAPHRRPRRRTPR